MKMNLFNRSPLLKAIECICLWGLLSLLLFGCETTPESAADSLSSETMASTIELSAPEPLPGSKVTDFDSLKNVLLPLILSPPIKREIELWYGRKNLWEAKVGNTENLISYIEHLYKQLDGAGEMSQAAAAKLAIARIFYLNAQYPEAVEQFQEALEISTNIQDSIMIGWTYNGLSTALFQLNDLPLSEDYMDRSLDLAQKTNNIEVGIVAILNKSSMCTHTGRMDSALLLLQEVIDKSKELDFNEIEKIALLNLSYYHIAKKDFDRAIGLLTNNPVISSGDISLVTVIHNLNLYEAYVGKEDYSTAYNYLLEGSTQSDSLGFAFGQAFCKVSMADHYERKGQYDLALKCFKEYHLIKENQAGKQARIELQSLKVKQNFQEKDWEIERLTRAEQDRAIAYKNRRNFMTGLMIILALIFLFFFLLQKNKTRADLANQNKEIAETRLQVLQSQINPHFVFNAITGIQNNILKSETIEAYNYLGKFSAILRVMAKTATSISIRLDQEVELINNYLALEKLRFRDGFIYSVEVSPDLANMRYKVPGMLVQPIVENAIIHGVSGLPYQGEIKVLFQYFGDGVKVTVSDNGRGRQAAIAIAKKEMDKHLSIASENADATLKALHMMGYEDADIKTLDLFDENGDPAGTEVTIYLPFFNIQKRLSK
ncbi:Tetratricopeptide repeat-containing protein [Neolewinella agarilytica]|uniref:Tetratricopeptide repeat-containing protein n=1 Tax=Neolewinella agarilytica TaxID=478744 RepID=A0A1H9JDZ8_9BACT|nr:Tetratricopeptide repeat-containing protein [Neolewinella agarilytica]